jgi:hypothetical protein
VSVRISRQHWDGLLGELDQARSQRHLLTYRALLERLQLPTPAMQTLTAALEHLAALDARAEQPLRSSLVISQGASRLPRTGFFRMCRTSRAFFRAIRRRRGSLLACLGSGEGVRIRVPRVGGGLSVFATQGAGQLLAGPPAVSLVNGLSASHAAGAGSKASSRGWPTWAMSARKAFMVTS